MTSLPRRATTGPVTPAGVAFLACVATCAAVVADPLRGLPVVALVWVLLGVTAGYSISGSV